MEQSEIHPQQNDPQLRQVLHGVNNDLTVVVSTLDLIKEDGHLGGQVAQDIDQALAGAIRAAQAIKELLHPGQ